MNIQRTGSGAASACFLTGARIATDHGDIAIEQLAEGDQVVTLDGSKRVLRSVQRLGRREIDLTGLDERAACEAAPIRIHAHAFAANVPTRDLLVTPEHDVVVDGSPIPVRLLINDASIVRDRSLLRFTVHHLQCDRKLRCERHAILISNGLAIESCFDTGNDDASGIRDGHPLPAMVEPIWRRLLSRAGQLGLMAPAASVSADTLASIPALRLRLDDGTVLRARSRTGERHFFVLPAGHDHAILLQRGAAPAPGQGMLVHSATLWMALSDTAIPLAASWLQGRHAPSFPGQPDGSDGEAEITFDAVSQTTILEVTLANA